MSLMGAYSALLHLLIGIGVVVFSVAEERPENALLAVPVVVFAYVLRRSDAAFGLPAWLLNTTLIGITAWSFSTAEWAIDQTVAELSQYIMLIQLVRLFEKPSSRKWAQEIGLSTMLVLGAALTNVALSVGLLIFVYCFVLLVTVLAHQVCVGMWRSTHENRVRVSPRMRRDFLRVCTTAATIVVVCSVAAFVLMPRGIGRDMIFGARFQQTASSVTQFSDSVTLGEQGLITDSSRLVMKVRLFGDISAPPYLFRGTALDSYDGITSRWTRSTELNEDSSVRTSDRLTDDLWATDRPGTAVTRVEIVQSDSPYLFALAGANSAATNPPKNYRIGSTDGTIRVGRHGRKHIREYAVRSERPTSDEPTFAGALNPELSAQFRDTGVPRIARAALESNGVEIDALDPTFRVRAVAAFMAHLKVGYGYTLDQVSPPAGVDPLTYFLEQTREGHCEYFASALAAMCRSVGIEARVVTGYVIIEQEDADTDLYAVRESHAHAWTEVEIAPGFWREYDASPPDGIAQVHKSAGGIRATYRRVMDSVQIVWSRYVVNFDEKRQSETLGTTLGGSGDGYEALGDRIEQFTELPRVRLVRLVVNAIATGLLVFVGSLAVFTIVRVLVRRFGLAGRGAKAPKADARGTEIGRVYSAMLAALAKAGLGKPEWRSPVSHAQTLAAIDTGLARSTREIASLYYIVAFGGRDVDAADSARAGEELTRIRTTLREIKRARVNKQ